MRTPELGLEFWQRDQKNLMFATKGEKRITRVFLKRRLLRTLSSLRSGRLDMCVVGCFYL
jgi:hypothetical protein